MVIIIVIVLLVIALLPLPRVGIESSKRRSKAVFEGVLVEETLRLVVLPILDIGKNLVMLC